MGKMNDDERYCRHGDVYIFDSPLKAADVRQRGKRIESGILAFGEATGHKHELMESTGYERYELDGKDVLIVGKEGVFITHEDHGIGLIDEGVKEIRIDREYDYLAEMARNSID